MEADELNERLRAGFGSTAQVRARRPGKLFQIELPAYLADGDAATIFVRPELDGRVTITDLGHTCMRLSYVRPVSGTAENTIRRIAERHGFKFHQGQIFSAVTTEDLFTSALRLAQIESEVEAAVPVRASRELRLEQFRTIVRDAIREAFARVTFDYYDQARDPEALYALDAVVPGPEKVLGLAVMPTELEAEHAVATRLFLKPVLESQASPVLWVALPSDLGSFREKTRARVEASFMTPMPTISRGGDQLVKALRLIQ